MAKQKEQPNEDKDVDQQAITADELRETYTEAVADIEISAIQDMVQEIKGLSAAAFKAKFSELYERIAASINPQRKIVGKEGFLLDRDDPFAEGSRRDYNRVYGCDERLPIVLGNTDRHTAGLLKMYYIRAAGGCDRDRAEAAKAALKKIAAGKGEPALAAAEVLDQIDGKKKKPQL